MNREIKFRAWDIQFKSMMYDEPETILHNYVENVIMQYTGLKDKNGKEIYEGDILVENSEHPKTIEVLFEHGAFIGRDIKYKTSVHNLSDYILSAFEIAGNIYENPELLNS